MSNISGQLYVHTTHGIEQVDISEELMQGTMGRFCVNEKELWVQIDDNSSKSRVICYDILSEGELRRKMKYGEQDSILVAALIPDNEKVYVSCSTKGHQQQVIHLDGKGIPTVIIEGEQVVLDMASLKDNSLLVNHTNTKELHHYVAGKIKKVYELGKSITTLSSIKGVAYICTNSGYYTADIKNGKLELSGPFLPHLAVNSIFQCREGILWLSTYNNGLLILPDEQNRLFPIIDNSGRLNSIPAMMKVDDGLVVGTNNGMLVKVSDNKLKLLDEFPTKINQIQESGSKYIVAGSRGLWSWSAGRITDYLYRHTVKAMDVINDGKVLVSLNVRAEIFDIENSQVQYLTPLLDTRTYACKAMNEDSMLVGNTDGLFLYDVKKGKLDGPFLEHNISDIEEGDQCYYVSTFSNGVFKSDLLGRSQKLELSSDNIKDIDYAEGKLAIATGQGVLFYDETTGNEVRFNKYNYLPTDNVESVLLDDDVVWVGSEAGLCRVRLDNTKESKPLLAINRISVADSLVEIDALKTLSPAHRAIKFEYLATSFAKTGKLFYSYRLLGMDTSWVTTKIPEVSFSNLPPGDYEFQIKASDGDTETLPELVSFSVAKEWHEYFFARLLLLGLFGLLIFWLSRYYLQRRVNEEKIKEAENKKIE